MRKKKITSQDNFYFLFLALITLFFASAAAQQFNPEGQESVLFMMIVCLAFSVAGVNKDNKLYRSWYGSLLVLAAISGVFEYFQEARLAVVTLLVLLAFVVSQTFSALKQVFARKEVELNQIIGSICVYMLMGLAWAIIYLIQMELFVGSFNGLEDKVWTHNLFEALYFSFITLTTVGYGDISPALPVPKFFVFMESIIGSFYVAILVASLVSSRLSQSEKKQSVKG
ncbi:potassium channel family protein [Vibrio astriarenae]|uniref:potassium channel family protein n=1 Tax=Vibrio astriarenae TaxID=1481923 RepID=UPI003734D263